ncbi:hypothetical protein H8697_03415 [[Eubacterium] tenue]|nr:hypothetical protein [[Eubacterium] tenue]MBC8630757.1 hypothetical protein [[Eubacterium] tenue]
MFDIDELLKLNRLRDKKIESIGDIKELKTCKNPNKVLNTKQEYEYEIVEVLDNYLYDIDNRGIVDEMVRMTFKDIDDKYQLKQCLKNPNGKSKELHGFYLKYDKVDSTNFHPFSTLFRGVEKSYMSKLESCLHERYFEEDHRSQARLLCFELLCGYNKSFNTSLKKSFNLDITDIDDFKKILSDINIADNVKKYINKVIANHALNKAYEGRNDDYHVIRKKNKNGKEKAQLVIHNNFRLDSSYNNSNDSNSYDYVVQDGIIEDNNHILDTLLENNSELVYSSFELYKYIFNNLEKILIKHQIKFFNDSLNNNLSDYSLSSISHTKIAIRKSIEDFFKDNKNINIIKGKFTLIKNTLADTLIDILDQLDNVQRLDKLVYYIKQENYASNFICDLIYSLDLRYRKNLTSLLLNKEIDNKENYANSTFIYILNILNNHLNFMLTSNEIFMFNRVKVDEKEFKIRKYIENNILNNKEVAKLPRKHVNGYTSIEDLHDFFNDILDTNISRNKLRDQLNHFGYDISNKASCSIDGYAAYRFFKC